MPTTLRESSLLFAACLALAACAAINTATAETKPQTSHKAVQADTSTSYARVDRPHAPKTTANASGDVITTDGQLSVPELGTTKPNIINPPTPVLQTRPAQSGR